MIANKKVLVLNKSWNAVAIINLEKALKNRENVTIEIDLTKEDTQDSFDDVDSPSQPQSQSQPKQSQPLGGY